MKIVHFLLGFLILMLCGCQSRSEDKRILDIASEYSLEQITADDAKKLGNSTDEETLKQASYILKTKSDTIIIISLGSSTSFGYVISSKDMEILKEVRKEYPNITRKEFLSEHFPEIYSLNLIFNDEDDLTYWNERVFPY